LGFVISKQLVEMMNGTIHVKSRPGCGTTFWFAINYALAKIDNIRDNQGQKKDLKKHEMPARARRILVAEDNIMNQKVAISLLKNLNYKDVIIAENGRKAVELYKTQRFDLILMDGQMPEMDGIESTKIIRKLEAGIEQIPVIAVTASAMAGDRERFLKAGMNDYISKPLKKKELDKVITRNIGSSGSSPGMT